MRNYGQRPQNGFYQNKSERKYVNVYYQIKRIKNCITYHSSELALANNPILLNLCIIATIGFRFNSSKYDIGCFIYLKSQSKLAKKIVYIIIMTATISHTMRKKLEAIKEMVSVQEAAKKMKEQSLLVVVDGSGKSQV